MLRPPRSSKRDHLVGMKMISMSYLQLGAIQAASAFTTYCWVMNDYGIRPVSTLFLANEQGYYPSPLDVYDPDLPNQGNSGYGKNGRSLLAWDLATDLEVDFRLFFTFKNRDTWTRCRWDPNDDSIPRFWRISDVTGKQICYTVEALRYT